MSLLGSMKTQKLLLQENQEAEGLVQTWISSWLGCCPAWQDPPGTGPVSTNEGYSRCKTGWRRYKAHGYTFGLHYYRNAIRSFLIIAAVSCNNTFETNLPRKTKVGAVQVWNDSVHFQWLPCLSAGMQNKHILTQFLLNAFCLSTCIFCPRGCKGKKKENVSISSNLDCVFPSGIPPHCIFSCRLVDFQQSGWSVFFLGEKKRAILDKNI